MAKPDWGEIQKWFLSDHAATGISPKVWCESRDGTTRLRADT